MTRKDLLAQYTDELVGLLTRAFAEEQFCQKSENLKPGSRETMIGQFIVAQWKAGKSLLERFAAEIEKCHENPPHRPDTVTTRKDGNHVQETRNGPTSPAKKP